MHNKMPFGTVTSVGPATWNSLPVELRTSTLSIETFVKKLKSHLFGC